MKTNLFYPLLATCFFSLAACQQTPQTPVADTPKAAPAKPDLTAIKAEIQTLENAWAAAFSTKDIATVMTFYSDDAISFADAKPMLVGKAAIQKQTETDFAERKEVITAAFETLDVFGDDNLITETGKSAFKDAAGKVIYNGKYMTIWEKRNGKWLTIREIFNDDAKAK